MCRDKSRTCMGETGVRSLPRLLAFTLLTQPRRQIEAGLLELLFNKLHRMQSSNAYTRIKTSTSTNRHIPFGTDHIEGQLLPVQVAFAIVSSVKKKVAMPATKELVEQLIASDTVVIFSKTTCPYCRMAKETFDKINKKYTAIELNNREDGDEIQSILGNMTGARTVPRVFVKGECLGGGSDVKALYESGELVKKF